MQRENICEQTTERKNNIFRQHIKQAIKKQFKCCNYLRIASPFHIK